MRRSKTLVTAIAATAAVAAIALVTGSLVQASSTDNNNLRRTLIAAENHPEAPLTEMTLLEFGQQPIPVPFGMVWSPASCQNFLEQAVPDLYRSQGIIRFNEMRNDADFEHGDTYMDLVATKTVDLSRVRQAALSCSNGTLSLEGKVTGSVRITQVPVAVPAAAAASLGLRIQVSFPAPSTQEAVETLQKFGYAAAIGIPIIKWIFQTLTQNGGTFFNVMSSQSGGIADQAVAHFHKEASALS